MRLNVDNCVKKTGHKNVIHSTINKHSAFLFMKTSETETWNVKFETEP